MKVIKIKGHKDLVVIVDSTPNILGIADPKCYKVQIAKPTKFLWFLTGYDILDSTIFIPASMYTDHSKRYRPILNSVEIDTALYVKEYIMRVRKENHIKNQGKMTVDSLPDQIDIYKTKKSNKLITFYS
jgi:hypothetical protein